MAVYYKYKSERNFYLSIPLSEPFMSVGTLKQSIRCSKRYGVRTKDYDLLITNAQTNQEYADEAMLIPKNTSIIVRRVPGPPRSPIIAKQEQSKGKKLDEVETEKSIVECDDTCAMEKFQDIDWHDFGDDTFAPKLMPTQSGNLIPHVYTSNPASKTDEDSETTSSVETPALNSQGQMVSRFDCSRSFGGTMVARQGLGQKIPLQGYVCHRCNVPGHFIQYCPTNGDPNYDSEKRLKPATSKTEVEIKVERLLSAHPDVGQIPPELRCPLCKEVMKDAAFMKCCFGSCCDRCIRDYFISRSICICGATNITVDSLIPNKTLRDMIDRMLEAGNRNTRSAGSASNLSDKGSTISSCITSITSNSNGAPGKSAKVQEETHDKNVFAVQPSSKRKRSAEETDVSKSARMPSVSMKEKAEQQVASDVEAGKKRRKKAGPSKILEDMGAENHHEMPPTGPYGFNHHYWNYVQPGLEGYIAPFPGVIPYMNHVGMAYGNVIPQDPYNIMAYSFPDPLYKS